MKGIESKRIQFNRYLPVARRTQIGTSYLGQGGIVRDGHENNPHESKHLTLHQQADTEAW
jgi:hypothetical protein